jgi:Holliday junction resolvasome RuvABC endonuclease subunit
MTVIGLDLSLTGTGLCLLDHDEPPTLTTIASKGAIKDTVAQRSARLQNLADRILAAVYGDIPSLPRLVVVEGPSVMSKGGSNWDRAGLWWWVVGALHAIELPVAVVPPSTLKKFAANNGLADKATVAVNLARLWPDTTAANDNEWDALGLATMGAQHLGRPVASRAHHAAARAGAQWPAVTE